ncbi:MAG: PAS domain S-box protein, partial [Gemmatimonadales bacterium]
MNLTIKDDSNEDLWLDVYRTLFDCAPDAIIVADGGHRIVMANEQAAELFGYTKSELCSMEISDLVPHDLRTLHEHHVSHYEPDRQRPMGSRRNIKALRRDGKVIPVDIALSPMGIQGHRYVMAAVRDISARLRAEAETKQLTEELRDALGEVDALVDLLPMCVSCKKIRNDRGYWTLLEAYMAEHAQMSFSHGLCP